MRTMLVPLIVIVALAGGFLLFQQQAKTPDGAQADIGSAVPRPGGQKTFPRVETLPPSDSVDTEGAREITIVADNYTFSTKALTLKKGQKVRLTFANAQGMHDFRIDELGVTTSVLKAGETQTVEFTPETPGTYEAFCSVGSHRAMGMTAAVTVEE